MNVNLKGVVMMVVVMVGFVVEDMLLKFVVCDVLVGLILMIFGVLGMVWFVVLVKLCGDCLLNCDLLYLVVGVKLLVEIVGWLFFVLVLVLVLLFMVLVLL